MKLFVDTSAFIALADKTDQNHQTASKFFVQLKSCDHLHTSNYVLDETITRLRFTMGHAAALHFAVAFFESRLYNVHYIDQRLEKLALGVFRKFHDQKLSFTDCTSVALMEDLRITGTFAFDDDFRIAGYRTFP